MTPTNQKLVRLLNLRKRLRERIKTSGADCVPPDILDLINEIEAITDRLIYETDTDGAAPPQ